jgi:hypothetical protein
MAARTTLDREGPQGAAEARREEGRRHDPAEARQGLGGRTKLFVSPLARDSVLEESSGSWLVGSSVA